MAVFDLTLLPEAVADLRGLDPEIRRRVRDKLTWLAQSADSIRHEALSGDLAGLFKRRVGSYRILYQLLTEEESIVVYRVAHRREVYGGS